MADLTSTALRVIHRQHGNITSHQLVKAGVTRATRVRLTEVGVLAQPYKSVYSLVGAPRTLAQRCSAVCLAHPGVYVTGPTAGTLMGLRKMPNRSPIVLASRHPLHVTHDGVLMRRTTNWRRSDVVARRDGVRLASPTRLAFDLAAHLGASAHRSVVDQLLHEQLTTSGDLMSIAQRLCHPRRRGSVRFQETLRQLGAAPTESHPEYLLAVALRARDIPIETQTTWLELPNGRRARVDLSVPALQWGVEVDVHPAHLGIEGTTGDKRRDRQAHLIGWQIERVTAIDLDDIDALADELHQLYLVRSRSFAA
jgi:hypothetical protein